MSNIHFVLRNTRIFGLIGLAVITPLIQSCGGTSIGNPINGNTTIQTHQLAGPNAAFMRQTPFDFLTNGLMFALFGVRNSYAVVSSFNKLQICLSSIDFERMDGSFEQINGSPNIPLAPGLIDLSPIDTNARELGRLELTPGTTLKNIVFKIAVVPDVCQGATFAVLFNGPTSGGDILITQNTSFRFDFTAPGYLIGSAQIIDVLFGQIVNGMVGLGAGLNNSTIQTVNVGQAQ